MDASFDTCVRANNKALSMRIIGQIFTYIIGQALALEGAKIPSSNTDGVYAFNIDMETNKGIVKEELKNLYIDIEPEPLYFVSKDSNNRLEMEEKNSSRFVTSARGSMLTSWDGARINNRLNHPAILDKVLTIYLQNEDIVNKPIDRDLVKKAFSDYQKELKNSGLSPLAQKRRFVYMSSWVMRPTSGSIFITEDKTHKTMVHPGTIRTWMTKTGETIDRFAVRKDRPSKTLDDYASSLLDEAPLCDPELLDYLTITDGLKYLTDYITVKDYKQLPEKTSFKRLSKVKISGLPENSYVTIDNRSILTMSGDDLNLIYKQIDMEAYYEMLEEFIKKWQNKIKPS